MDFNEWLEEDTELKKADTDVAKVELLLETAAWVATTVVVVDPEDDSPASSILWEFARTIAKMRSFNTQWKGFLEFWRVSRMSENQETMLV